MNEQWGEKVTWYPGHMKKAMEQLEDRISDVQLFIELRDARVPFSSKNYHFDSLMEKYNKEKIILFNKFDICNQEITGKIIEKYRSVGIKCLQVSAREQFNLREVLSMAQTCKQAKFATVGIWLMICGMPNVGKSTIINQLRQKTPKLNKRKAVAKVKKDEKKKKIISQQTPLPCTTKNVSGIRICDEPLAYLVDSPGVMVPNITDLEVGLKLGVKYTINKDYQLVGCIKDTIVEKEKIVDYMVWQLNKQKEDAFFKYYGLNQRPANGGELLLKVRDRYFQYNYETTLDFIIGNFRDGKLGKVTLDDVNILM